MPGGSGYSSIIIFAVIIVAFYFLLIRPEGKRKQVTQMRSELAVGDEITTIGGITGVVCGIKNDLITIESGEDRVRIQIMRWAISSRGPVDVPAPAAASTEKTEGKKFSLFGKKR